MKIICLDAGHGGAYPGAVNGNRLEKDDAFKMTNRVKSLLEAQGVKVLLTRTGDYCPELSERCAVANNGGADYFLSIHRNSAAVSATGIEIWVHSRAYDSIIRQADGILQRLCDVAPVYNRGVKKGYIGDPNSDFAVNRETNMPSAMLELLFISNDNDNKIFDANFDEYAVAIAKGLCAAVGVDYTDTNPKPQGGTYTVKSGDSFWSIAEQQLGDGTRYKELAAYNGMSIDHVIHPGDVLKLPGTSQPAERIYTVKPNDSFWRIAEQQLGDGTRYKELAAYNGMSIDHIIHPGDILKLPR